MTIALPQLSVAMTSAARSGTVAWQFVSAGSVRLVAQALITGDVVSSIVTRVAHWAVLPASSEAVITTSVAPAMSVPAAGACVMVTMPQLSEAVTSGVKSGTAARQLASAAKARLGAQARIIGGVVSMTVISATQLLELPAVSETVSVTAVTPRDMEAPAGGF
jgi:hypothetical protein